VRENRGVGVGDATGEIVNAATRLLSLMGDARDAELLGPLVMDEILIRLLRGPLGPRLAQIGREDTGAQRVTKAVDWVRAHFDQPMAVEALAELVHMSPSAFHGHFKAVTNMSPLQFQKALRLREARRLVLTANMDVAGAGRQVGYVSASQFIREYRRLFGNALARDVALLRQQGEAQTDLNSPRSSAEGTGRHVDVRSGPRGPLSVLVLTENIKTKWFHVMPCSGIVR